MYAVFGVTRAVAKAAAIKRVKAFRKQGNTMVALTLQEYTERLEAETDKQFNAMAAKQLSPLYTMPEPARLYLDIARKDGARLLHIRRRKQKLDGDGKPELHPRSKSPVTYWEGYNG